MRFASIWILLFAFLKLAGTRPRPALEGSCEITLIGKANQKCDLCMRVLLFFEVRLGKFAPCGCEHVAVTRVLGTELPLQRAGTAMQSCGNRFLINGSGWQHLHE